MLTLITGIMFILFTCVFFRVWEFYEGGHRVFQAPMNCPRLPEIEKHCITVSSTSVV
jgi:hypothetical protein